MRDRYPTSGPHSPGRTSREEVWELWPKITHHVSDFLKVRRPNMVYLASWVRPVISDVTHVWGCSTSLSCGSSPISCPSIRLVCAWSRHPFSWDEIGTELQSTPRPESFPIPLCTIYTWILVLDEVERVRVSRGRDTDDVDIKSNRGLSRRTVEFISTCSHPRRRHS